MFTWVGTQFSNLLDTYSIGVVSSLMTRLAPVALSAMTLWVGLYGWAILRNQVSEPLPEFAWKVFKVGVVLAFALQSAFYLSNVADTANSLAMGVATSFLPTAADPMAIRTPYVLLDTFNDRASQLAVDLMKEAWITRLDMVFAAVATAFGNVIFLCIALYVVTLAKVLLTFVIAVGPVFILCLAWRPTARFFDSWLSMLLNTVVLTWFAFFALGLSVFIGDAMVQAIQGQGGFAGPTFNPVAESLKYCIVMILMAIICFQAPSLSSALTGGAAVQQGIQMVQNAMMVSGLRSASSARAVGAAGGVVRAGVGVPYAAGHTAGAAAAATGRAAAAMGVTRAGQGPEHVPAYMRAAQRGRA
jgi:type IV secretion system protein VirB6